MEKKRTSYSQEICILKARILLSVSAPVDVRKYIPHLGFKAFSYKTIKEEHRFLERLSGLCYEITQLKDTFLLRKPEVNFLL